MKTIARVAAWCWLLSMLAGASLAVADCPDARTAARQGATVFVFTAGTLWALGVVAPDRKPSVPWTVTYTFNHAHLERPAPSPINGRAWSPPAVRLVSIDCRRS